MIEVLPAQPQDASRIHEIYVQAALHKHQYSDHSWRDGFSIEGVMRMIDSGDTYAVYLDKKLVGAVGLEREDDGWDDNALHKAGYIHRMAVGNGYHGQQIGRQIMGWASKEVKRTGRQYLRLDCSVDNKNLCAYYEKAGFELVKTKYFPDFDVTAGLYQRSVD